MGRVHQDDGEPASGATVHVAVFFAPLGVLDPVGWAAMRAAEGRPSQPREFKTTTDLQGRFAMPWSLGLGQVVGVERFRVWATRGRMVTPAVVMRAHETPAQVEPLTLGPAIEARLRLVDPDGQPVTPAHVQLTLTKADEPDSCHPESILLAGACTDRDGLARLPLIEDSPDWHVSLRIHAPGMPRPPRSALGLDALRDPSLIEVRMPRGLAVSGRVVAPDGLPLQGVAIEARRERGDPDPNPGHGTQTASDGTFTLRGVPTEGGVITLRDPPPGTAWHEVRQQQSAPPRLVLEVRGEEGGRVDLGIIEILEPSEITGTVLDPDGQPAQGGHVFLNRVGRSHPIDPHGRFRSPGVAPGRHALKTTIVERGAAHDGLRRGHLVATRQDVPAGARDLVIQVTGGGNLIVRFHPKGRPDQTLHVRDPQLIWPGGGTGSRGTQTEIRHVLTPGVHTDLRIEAEEIQTTPLGPIEIHPDRPTRVDAEIAPA